MLTGRATHMKGRHGRSGVNLKSSLLMDTLWRCVQLVAHLTHTSERGGVSALRRSTVIIAAHWLLAFQSIACVLFSLARALFSATHKFCNITRCIRKQSLPGPLLHMTSSLCHEVITNTSTPQRGSPGVMAESVEHGSRLQEIVGSNPWLSQSDDL